MAATFSQNFSFLNLIKRFLVPPGRAVDRDFIDANVNRKIEGGLLLQIQRVPVLPTVKEDFKRVSNGNHR